MFKLGKKEIRALLIIILSSVFVHFFLIFVTGAWWDDWKFYVNDFSTMRDHYISAGRLDAYLLLSIVSSLPDWAYRLTVLICYITSAIFIYMALLNVFADHQMALIISVLYNAIPVNDLRVMRCVFPFAIATTLFWAASYLLLISIDSHSKLRRMSMRVAALSLFFVSFSTNSLMFFYIAPICFLWIKLWLKERTKGNSNIFHFIKSILKYPDFYFIPFIFFVIKKIWLSPEAGGLYSSYNQITIPNLCHAIILMPNVLWQMCKSVAKNWVIIVLNYRYIIFFYLIIIVIFSLAKRKFDLGRRIKSFKVSCVLVVCGLAMILMGLYPYVVIRLDVIGTTGTSGRDAMLVCIGFAILIYGFFALLRIPSRIQYALVSCIILTSCIHFSYWYCLYQGAYYEQVALQSAWVETEDVRTGRTFIYIRMNEGTLALERFYTLNALSKRTYGDSKRFVAKGVSNLMYLTTFEKAELMRNDNVNSFDEYDMGNTKIDGIMIASYSISHQETIRLKWLEICDHNAFLAGSRKCLNYEYIPVDESLSEAIYNGYLNGTITYDDQLLRFVAD